MAKKIQILTVPWLTAFALLDTLCVIGRSHRAGDATYNNGRPRLRRRSTARLEQSAGRNPSQPIFGCLQTFIENSLLYSVFY